MDNKYIPLSEHTEQIGKTTFIVSSFADSRAGITAEQLILQLLENKIINSNYETEVSA